MQIIQMIFVLYLEEKFVMVVQIVFHILIFLIDFASFYHHMKIIIFL